MRYFVYILLSERDDKLYVGCTHDLEKRLELHNSGQVNTTKYRRPLKLIHQESFKEKAEAFNRERFLKSLWGGRFKKKIRDEYLKSENG